MRKEAHPGMKVKPLLQVNPTALISRSELFYVSCFQVAIGNILNIISSGSTEYRRLYQ